jgi:RHS repeat-associated protein
VLRHAGTGVRLLRLDAGTLLGTQTFDPWGNGGTADGGALQFTAHERDAATFGTGNTAFPDYMHERYFDGAGGRFLAVDPEQSSRRPMRPQTWNRYSYARNNPISLIDPDGRAEKLAVLHLRVTIYYDNNTVNEQRLFGRGPLRDVVERSIPRARSLYGAAGIALDVQRVSVNMNTLAGADNYSIVTPSSETHLMDVAGPANGLWVFVSNNFSWTGKTQGVGGPTLIGSGADSRTLMDDPGHALGNVTAVNDLLGVGNAVADVRLVVQESFVHNG